MTKEIREYLNTCADVNSSYKEPECWLKKIDAITSSCKSKCSCTETNTTDGRNFSS